MATAVVSAIATGLASGFTLNVTGALVFELTFAQFAVTALGSLALSFVSQALAPKPPKPVTGNFAQQVSQGRNSQFRQPITPWDIVYGEIIKSGPITFVEVTDSNRFLHMVITLAAHESQSIDTIYFNDVAIYPDQLDGDGIVQTGKYANLTRIQWELGASGNQPFPNLVTESSIWDNDYIQEGHTKLYFRLDYDKTVFEGGVPNIKVRMKGKKILDPRTVTTFWQPNPALCIDDYMRTSLDAGGLGITVAEVDQTQLIASSNTCDEAVAVKTGVDHTAISPTSGTVWATGDFMDLEGSEFDVCKFQTGDTVQLTTTDTLPAGLSLATDYFLTIVHERQSDVEDIRIKFSTTYANVFQETFVDITDEGVGTHTISKTEEPRYTLNGLVITDSTPNEVLNDMRTSLAGRILPVGGLWYIMAGYWETPTVLIDEDDLAAPISLKTKHSRRERFNAVKGIYINPVNSGQPSDYPPVTNSTYESEDNSERIFRELDLAYTTRGQTAQRIGTIELQRHRRQVSCTLTTNLMGLQLQAANSVKVTNSRFGWTEKTFEIAQWKLLVDGDPPSIKCEMVLREADSTIFTFDENAEETIVEPPPTTNLGNAGTVLEAGAPSIAEELFVTRDGAGVKTKATLTWIASTDGFLLEYAPAYRVNGDVEWIELSKTTELQTEIFDISAGFYDFRVRTINTASISSDGSETLNHEIQGLGAAPSAVTNLTISQISSLALLEWDKHTELDVTIGGKFLMRHSPELTGATVENSTRVGKADGYPGISTQVLLPQRTGTYFVIPVDSIGIVGTEASIATTQARLLSFGNLSTIDEHPTFAGTHSSTHVVSSKLTLIGVSLMDTWADVDSVADWDYEGGVTSSGTYTFATGFDLGSATDVRLTANIKAQTINQIDKIDSRLTNIDTWTDFDGVTGANADAQVFVRQTADDPTGSPTWSDYTILTVGDFSNRAFEFEARLTTDDSAYNITVEELTVTKEELT